MKFKKLIYLLTVLSLLGVIISGCSTKDTSSESTSETSTSANSTDTTTESITLKIGATPLPHAEILNVVKPILESKGITLEIVEFTDYVTPNIALNDGEIDANFFQHVPYLESFNADHNYDLVSVATVHIEPLGLYSDKIDAFESLENGSTIAIPNDPTNEGRALLLLENNGLITLSETAGLEATELDIIDNPLNLTFVPIDAAQLPRTLVDVDAAVINTNYALEAGLNPSEDALIIEGSESPYANILVVRPEDANNPAILELIETLHSEEVKSFIETTYEGAIVPTF